MKIFSERLRELRVEKGLSMKQLAVKLNTTDAAISNWENEVNEPKISYLVSIANFFEVSTDYLLGLSDEQ
ncbi:MAG: helix-turn-helix transcriptional regulator [Clostridiales bacterium]|nr:helix-turn-helix transcriptional regulator [Candidatus Apopatousia equi]